MTAGIRGIGCRSKTVVAQPSWGAGRKGRQLTWSKCTVFTHLQPQCHEEQQGTYSLHINREHINRQIMC